jgi:hypothetical protein
VGVEAATALRQEHRLKLFEQNVLRILATEREEATAGGENYAASTFTSFTFQ